MKKTHLDPALINCTCYTATINARLKLRGEPPMTHEEHVLILDEFNRKTSTHKCADDILTLRHPGLFS